MARERLIILDTTLRDGRQGLGALPRPRRTAWPWPANSPFSGWM